MTDDKKPSRAELRKAGKGRQAARHHRDARRQDDAAWPKGGQRGKAPPSNFRSPRRDAFNANPRLAYLRSSSPGSLGSDL
jgi:hypothetical protein